MRVGLEESPGGPVKQRRDEFSSPDALISLSFEDRGEGGLTVLHTVRHFNPEASMFFLHQTSGILETIRKTRLATLKEDMTLVGEVRTFFDIDRDLAGRLDLNRLFQFTVTA